MGSNCIIDMDNGIIVLQLTDAVGRQYQHSYNGQSAQLAYDVREALKPTLDLREWDGDETEDDGWVEVEDWMAAYDIADVAAMSASDAESIGSGALIALVRALTTGA